MSLNKQTQFSKLSDKYVEQIKKVLDYAVTKRIVPIKVIFGINLIKEYIDANKLKILECGVEYILKYKDEILNFSLESLDETNLSELSESSNFSSNYITNINELKNIIKQESKSTNTSTEELEIINLIIDIINNAKKLSLEEIDIIKNYIELIVLILEKIKIIFIE
jgi:hypothetical protein